MADRIKGITIKLDGDATGLDKALKGVNNEIKDTEKELKDVNRLLKIDPSNTELLTQKQKLLTKEIGDTENKLKTLQNAAKDAKKALDTGASPPNHKTACGQMLSHNLLYLHMADRNKPHHRPDIDNPDRNRY